MVNGTKLAAEYETAHGFYWTGLDSLATGDGDYVHVKPIITLLETWMPILTTAGSVGSRRCKGS